jgi:hypothetical protein
MAYGAYVMSFVSAYQTTCRFCAAVEAGLVPALTATADFFAVVRAAKHASDLAMNGDYENAKKAMLDM